ncbi:DUF3108 domain-containing protein [Gimibacter soli]|uniref:DUF3108 domain-containing protein n=1 Tax=Gimibacter soli TaxID=3024400 RepID=A0AAE9XX57_9PROT|nr:DUF3108 domain-containing protein [Gimibacter soli]WCL55164.1 DUF3108 domain-containing protein [Gimibacter soli]
MTASFRPLFIGAAAASLMAALPVRAETHEASYEFRWGGLLIGESDVRLTTDEDSYKIETTFRTRGLLSLFSKGESRASATGDILPDGTLAPDRYVSEGRWGGDDYRRMIRYDDTGRVAGIEQDWPEEWLKDDKREPVPEDQQTGPDPLSLLVAAVSGATLPGGVESDRVWRSFEGRSVIDFRVRCLDGMDEVPESRHSPIAGEAVACGLTSEIVAGKPIETEKERKKREKREAKELAAKDRGHDDERDGTLEGDLRGLRLWLQRDEVAGLWLPIRARMRSGWGTVRMIMVASEVSDSGAESVASR